MLDYQVGILDLPLSSLLFLIRILGNWVLGIRKRMEHDNFLREWVLRIIIYIRILL